MAAQLVVKLSSDTLSAFDQYLAKAKDELTDRWTGKRSFLAVSEQVDARQHVLAGEVFAQQMNGGHPLAIPHALIHDWTGAIFIHGVKANEVAHVLADFDRHSKIYPAVAESRIIERRGDTITGFWRLEQKGLVPVTLEARQQVRYRQQAPGKWTGETLASHIDEIDKGVFGSGHKFPPDEGHGYLWRLHGFWSLEEVAGGVIAEARTLSLSRDIPNGLEWAVKPYLEKTPKQSLTGTLTATRKALEQSGHH